MGNVQKTTRQKRVEALERARQAPKGRRKPRAEKMAAHAASFAEMRREFPRLALPIIARVEAGSLAAAVQLKCLDCSSWARQEVRDCTVTDCPLYPVRPYQTLTSGNPNDPGKQGPAPLVYGPEHGGEG